MVSLIVYYWQHSYILFISLLDSDAMLKISMILCDPVHYSDVIMSMMEFQITGLTIVYSTIYSVSVSLAFVRGIHQCNIML